MFLTGYSAGIAVFFFSGRRRHTRWTGDWSSDVCSSDLSALAAWPEPAAWPELAVWPELAAPGTAPGRLPVTAEPPAPASRTPRNEPPAASTAAIPRTAAHLVNLPGRRVARAPG